MRKLIVIMTILLILIAGCCNTEETKLKADSVKLIHNIRAEGTPVDVKYVHKPSTFGPDITKTIIYFKDGRVLIFENTFSIKLNVNNQICSKNGWYHYAIVDGQRLTN